MKIKLIIFNRFVYLCVCIISLFVSIVKLVVKVVIFRVEIVLLFFNWSNLVFKFEFFYYIIRIFLCCDINLLLIFEF